MTSPLPARAAPRWPTLLMLVVAVASAHLLLLTGGLPSWSVHTPEVAAPRFASDARSQTLAPAAALSPQTALPPPAAALTSQVRWIAPPAVQLPTPSHPDTPVAQAKATAPVPTPRPAPAPTPAAGLPTPAPAARLAATAPVAESERLSAPPATEPPPDPADGAVTATATTTTSADIRNATPEPSTEVLQPTHITNTVLAQTTAQRNTTSASAGDEAAAANTQPGSAQPPASAQLRYSVEGQSRGLTYNASGTLDWRNEGGFYSARMEIQVFLLGSRVQTSQGQLSATGLQPERFGDKSRSERAAHFDRSQNRIRFSNNAPDADLLPGAQDRLSVFLQLAGLLNARPEAYAAGQSVDIPVAGTSGSEIWRFRVQGLVSLDLPAGSLIAQHLVREPREPLGPRDPRDTRVDIWLAPSLGHLPVRLRLAQDNGDVVDQRLTSLP